MWATSWGSGGLVPTRVCPHPLQAPLCRPHPPHSNSKSSSRRPLVLQRCHCVGSGGLSQDPLRGMHWNHRLVAIYTSLDLQDVDLVSPAFFISLAKLHPNPGSSFSVPVPPGAFFPHSSGCSWFSRGYPQRPEQGCGEGYRASQSLVSQDLCSCHLLPLPPFFFSVFGLGENTPKGRGQATYKQTTLEPPSTAPSLPKMFCCRWSSGAAALEKAGIWSEADIDFHPRSASVYCSANY